MAECCTGVVKKNRDEKGISKIKGLRLALTLTVSNRYSSSYCVTVSNSTFHHPIPQRISPVLSLFRSTGTKLKKETQKQTKKKGKRTSKTNLQPPVAHLNQGVAVSLLDINPLAEIHDDLLVFDRSLVDFGMEYIHACEIVASRIGPERLCELGLWESSHVVVVHGAESAVCTRCRAMDGRHRMVGGGS